MAYQVPGWEVAGGSLVVCTAAYDGAAVDDTSADCEKGAVVAPDGRAMVQLEYSANCLSRTYRAGRCSDYLGQPLGAPLRLGTTYELSALIYVPTAIDPTYARHVGFSLYPEHPGVKANRMLEGHEFTLDTVVFNQWYRVSWRFRPTCDLQYLALGVFSGRDGPATYRTGGGQERFYLDDLSLRAVPGEGRDAPAFCRTLSQEERVDFVAGGTAYFASGRAMLAEDQRAALDSLALRIRANPQSIYRISGHTDATGSDHLELSDRRIDSTLAYLQRYHQISPLRFLRQPVGTARAIDAAVDGARNRRVEISHLGGDQAALLYRHLLEAVRREDTPTAGALLRIWLAIAPEEQVALAPYDPRLRPVLKIIPNRKRLEARINDRYSRIDRENGTWLLDSLWREDQLPRTLGRYLENMAYYDREMDADDPFWDVSYPELTEAIISARDTRHALLAQDWLAANGWPRASVVGETAARAIPLALIHGGDADALDQALPRFKAACHRGEADWAYYALLYDRAQQLRGLPQRYGTQYVDGKRWPLENADSLASWRWRIGLE
ncbi:OmpA family protein [Lewinella sp. 4G2]|uniref:OmpA family protein n=1 Tax=Lewinella sp. 4G2 TaxID=1803372 RepID=UPI0007B471CF|nr:OmpA family protein [Lewinella sp. 4G2]OAV45949.1 hypothetical protein A3850_018800 [Lewinella sp. 4G2]